MPQPRIKSSLAVLFALCASLILAGCGDSVDGTYAADMPGGGAAAFSLQFKSGGKCTVSVMGESKEGTYTIKGDKITVTLDKNPAVFIKQKDGTLQGQGEMSVTLKKKN